MATPTELGSGGRHIGSEQFTLESDNARTYKSIVLRKYRVCRLRQGSFIEDLLSYLHFRSGNINARIKNHGAGRAS